MRIVFIGTGEIGIPALRALLRSSEHQLVGVVTQPDKPVGRDQRIQPPPIKAELAGKNVPILQPARIRNEAAIAEIRAFAPEIIIVMAYGQILPKRLLEMPTMACLNLHASILPRHRGAAPIQASILAGDQSSGLTVMYMAEGLDTGDVLLAQSIAIRRRETGGSLHDRLATLAPAALATAFDLILTGRALRTPQDESNATYAAKLERESGHIDWSQDCWQLDRLIRAMNPWPGSFTLLRSGDGALKKLKVHRALPVHRLSGAPG